MGIEPTTSSLPRTRSTPELSRLLNHQIIANLKTFPQSLLDQISERETRFEPATYSLEGCRSTN